MMRNFKKDFPLLDHSDVAYLDNAATTQRPAVVLDAERTFYETSNANPLRGVYDLAVRATESYEQARQTVASFIHASGSEEIVFTRNTTESINLVAYSYGLTFLKPGDEIVVTIAEHHSNILPWQMVAKKTGAVLKYLDCEPDGRFSEEAIDAVITDHTKLFAIAQVSNVIGRKNPIEAITKKVHEKGGVVVVDGAQSVPHMPVDVRELDADFFAFSGHKLFGPMGIGVLYGKKELLDQMPPFMSGGEMIQSVTREGAVFAELPHKFEAGTVNAGGAAGLKAAIEYVEGIGFDAISEAELAATTLALSQMRKIPHVHIIGSPLPEEHNGIINFTIDDIHPHDIAAILDTKNVCVRAGHHCAQPLLAHLGVNVTARASLTFYNTEEDVMRFVDALKGIRRLMGYGE